MKAIFSIGIRVWTANLMGANGGNRVHASSGTITEITEDGKYMISGNGYYSCDGDLMHGVPGMYRGIAGIICEVDSSEEKTALDAAITCENCRKALGLAPVKKSVAASATLAAALEAEKKAKRIVALTKKMEYALHCVASWNERLAEMTAKYEAGDEYTVKYYKGYSAHYRKSIKTDTAIAEICKAEIAELSK